MRGERAQTGILLPVLLAGSLAFSQTPFDLMPGTPAERTINGGESHVYRVTLPRDQFAQAVVTQRDTALVIALADPQGKPLGEVDQSDPPGDETVFFLAEPPGVYRVEIRAGAGQPSGRYEIKLAGLRPATARDRILFLAQAASIEAARLRKEGSKESNQKALRAYERAAGLWAEAEYVPGQASALLQLSFVHAGLNDGKAARASAGRALELYRNQSDRIGEARAIGAVGMIDAEAGETQDAESRFQESATLARQSGDRRFETRMRLSLADLMLVTGRVKESVPAFEEILASSRGLGESGMELGALNGLGRAYDLLGERHTALDRYAESLKLARGVARDPSAQATLLNNIALVNQSFGELQLALDGFLEATSIARSLGNPIQEAIFLGNIGATYAQMGDREASLDFVERALKLHNTHGSPWGKAYSLDYLCNLRRRRGELKQALSSCQEALALRRSIQDRSGEPNSLKELGLTYAALGDWQVSAAHLQDARELARTAGDRLLELQALIGLGNSQSELRRNDDARSTYEEALQLASSMGDPPREAITRLWLARLDRREGAFESARAHLAEAMTMVETTRSKVAAQRLRNTYLASNTEIYEEYVGVLMDEHRRDPSRKADVLALEINERARARSLLEALAEVRGGIREGVDSKLLERERRLRQQLNAASRSPNPTVRGLLAEFEQLEAEIRLSSPHYAALTLPRPMSASEIQSELDIETVLLEYSLGQKESFVWVVTSNSIRSFALPKAAEIEAAAGEVAALVAGRKPAVLLGKAAATLSASILGPIRPQIRGKRLAIVADGALHMIPFAALPGSPGNAPLGIQFEIVTLPSASALALARRELRNRPPAPRTLAVLADPVFDMEDSRVAGAQPKAISSLENDLERSAKATSLLGTDLRIPRLPFARREAEAILSLAPVNQRKRAVDFDASLRTALSPELAEYRIVHFATHGLLNSDHPELSGLVLSLVDEQGKPRNGFLRLVDIYNLRLSADLVVLSACQTGIGRQMRGEGLISLTRGFFYAGAPRVLASLWRVDDRATAELMKRFYEGMLGPKGLSAASALRGAQAVMSKDPRWRHPYYWAGFVLHGDWR